MKNKDSLYICYIEYLTIGKFHLTKDFSNCTVKIVDHLKVIRQLAADLLKSIPRFPAPSQVVSLPDTVVQSCIFTPG